MTTVNRSGAFVTKRLDRSHLSGVLRLEHATTGHLENYLADLTAAGVPLPEDLEIVVYEGVPGVRHRWIDGPPLRMLASVDPGRFVEAVTRISRCVDALRPSRSRLDTNLDNFVAGPSGSQITCVDVLPPLHTDLARAPNSPWQEVLMGLCFDSDTTVCALAGYARHTLATAAGPGQSARRCSSLESLCPGHRQNSLADVWFHARLLAAGHPGDPEARALWRATSVSALLRTPLASRSLRLAWALDLVRTSSLEHS